MLVGFCVTYFVLLGNGPTVSFHALFSLSLVYSNYHCDIISPIEQLSGGPTAGVNRALQSLLPQAGLLNRSIFGL